LVPGHLSMKLKKLSQIKSMLMVVDSCGDGGGDDGRNDGGGSVCGGGCDVEVVAVMVVDGVGGGSSGGCDGEVVMVMVLVMVVTL